MSQEKSLAQYQQSYFLGIGGIGMSAIARYFLSLQLPVYGYDKTPSPLTENLANEGASISFSDAVIDLPEAVCKGIHNTLFILTPAIPKDHPQWVWLLEHGAFIQKRSEVLGFIAKNSFCIAVAGTHGKTTTSTLIAHLLHGCNINFTAFLGGISSNFNSNYIRKINGIALFQEDANKEIVVLEADEFDRSFHRLSPDLAIITAIDPDHLDIYENTAAFTEAFVHFASLIRSVVDTYYADSTSAPVGKIATGAFSGKDPSKVDRSAGNENQAKRDPYFAEGDEPSVSKTSSKNRTGNPGDGNPEFDLRRDKPHGAGLVIQESIHITTQKSIAKCTYGLGVNAVFRARDVRVEQGDYCFDFIYAGQFLGRFRCGLPGHHNVQNTLAALGICHGFLGLPIKELQEGIASFKGAKRRFETVVKTAKHIVIDDYAHHPEEIKAIVHSVRTLYPNKHITGLFQPHLFSRTKDFAREFADSLSALDTVWLMDIYPARENPIPGITSTWLLEMIQNPRKHLLSADQIHTEIYNSPPELLLILGAGDIDRLIEPVRKQYEEISTSHQ
ncbi:MAG: hypothetical protein CK532_07585 [Flavobacteriales bacterium]|nr:MAG: hypothetical protein CK532_07585 [Flavobacteriales bacterium]